MERLTISALKEQLHYCPESGQFTWLVTRNRIKAGDVGGYVRRSGYVRIGIFGRFYMAHRLAWFYMTGAWPEQVIDHINGDPADNSWNNLRDVSPAINAQNRKGAVSGRKHRLPRGVYTQDCNSNYAKPYIARAYVNGRHINGAYHSTIEGAAAEAEALRNEHHRGCAQ